VPPPSPLTTLMKVFTRMCTRLVSTIPVVAVVRSQPLPHRPCRKRIGAARSPTFEPPTSTRTTPQPHHHGGANTATTMRKRGERPPAHPRSCCLFAERPVLNHSRPPRSGATRGSGIQPRPLPAGSITTTSPWPHHPQAAKAWFRQVQGNPSAVTTGANI
jgi:hypothetical protein